MSSPDEGRPDALTAAIVAYVGYGVHRTPVDDRDAVLALDPIHGARTLELVEAIVRASDTLHIPLKAFGKENMSVLFGAEFDKIWPGLSEQALYALTWRWAYNEFS